MSPRVLYVASPLGFSEFSREHYVSSLLPRLCEEGFEVLDPWAGNDAADHLARALQDPEPSTRLLALRAANRAVGKRNAALIEASEAVLAILDGPDVDSGTAAEVGFACALRRPIVGLRTDTRMAGDNEATPVNLQVAYFVESSGGAVVGTLDQAVAHLRRLLP